METRTSGFSRQAVKMLDVGASAIADAIRNADGPAVCAYVTAGYPTKGDFPDVLRSVAAAADVVEIGVPFTDPMADGMTIQRASRAAKKAEEPKKRDRNTELDKMIRDMLK